MPLVNFYRDVKRVGAQLVDRNEIGHTQTYIHTCT
jgi:hypothetical protein